MVSDEEVEKLVEEVDEKDVTQSDKIEENVGEEISQMGFLWDRVSQKLKDDKTCFECKKVFDYEKEKPKVLETTSTEKGVVAFVTVCDDCIAKKIEEEDKKEKLEGEKNE